MNKKIFKFIKKYLVVTIFTTIIGCTESIDVIDGSKSSGFDTTTQILNEKCEELAFLALNGNYLVTEDELEENISLFLNNGNKTFSRSARNASFTKLKTDILPISFNSTNKSQSKRTLAAYFDENVPIYYYSVEEEDSTNLIIASRDRRIGMILAYIKNCTIDTLYIEDSPSAIFIDNLSGYVQTIADIWNRLLTDEYLNSARSTVATEIVISGEYSYSDWSYNFGNENFIIPSYIANNVGQSKFRDIVYSNRNLKYNGCVPTAAMQLICFYQYPKTITMNIIDADGNNYMGTNIWTDVSEKTLQWNSSDCSIKNSNWYNIGQVYYYQGWLSVFTAEFEYANNNQLLSISNFKERYDMLYTQANDMRVSYSYQTDDGQLLSTWRRYKYLEGRAEAYNKLKKKSYSSFEKVQKYLSDSIRDSNKYLDKYTPLVNESVYQKICALFCQTVIGCNAQAKYDENHNQIATGAYTKDCVSYMRSIGYTMNDMTDYSFNKIKDSIDNGCPVITSGSTGDYLDLNGVQKKSTGHAWVIDGYANLFCKAIPKTGSTKNAEINLTANYVHCNWGWDGSKHGYYLNGVFDATSLPLYTTSDDTSRQRSITTEDSSNKAGYYQHSLKIVTNIKPAN